VRMALIGALRSGQVDWRCAKWREIYTGESEATYDENGGVTSEMPKYGWPSDFWQPALAAENIFWRDNVFISYGNVTMLDAPYKVRLWMGRNNRALAKWTRYADDVEFNWNDVSELLGGPGWQAWALDAHHPKSPPARSSHYTEALIRLIGIAILDPNSLRDRLFEVVHESFDLGGNIPDDADLKRLTKRIRAAIQPIENDPPP
jgi:hypothetical protein